MGCLSNFQLDVKLYQIVLRSAINRYFADLLIVHGLIILGLVTTYSLPAPTTSIIVAQVAQFTYGLTALVTAFAVFVKVYKGDAESIKGDYLFFLTVALFYLIGLIGIWDGLDLTSFSRWGLGVPLGICFAALFIQVRFILLQKSGWYLPRVPNHS
ncbi:MAG: hypothetical protein EPO32_08715 [Anaerolineae bacterium]|nr:MAG: hypothetical protein EPO32_08715 [Anaerolineae bacterium]